MPDTTNTLDILNRMLEALKTTNDSELARFLGVSPQAISKSRALGKIPAPWPYKFAALTRVSMDWLCFGVGRMWISDHSEQEAPPESSLPANVACERCRTLEEGRWQLSEENRQLLKENSQLLKENGMLKLENLSLTHQLEAARIKR